MPRRHVWVGVVAVAIMLPQVALAQTPAERVEAARKLLAGSKFADAAKAVEAAIAQPGNNEESMIALYELSGIAAAELKQTQKARVSFQRVLSLDPAHKLTGKWSPKVNALFNEARKSMARAGGKLSLEQLTPEIKGTQVIAVYFSIENDVLKLGKKARVHLRQDNGPWTVQEIPIGPTMKADTTGKSVEWWAELLGDHGETLAHVASEDKPLVDAIPGAPPPKKGDATAAAPPKKDDKKDPGKKDQPKTGAPVADKKASLTPPPKEPPPVVVAPESKGKKVRILPWALVGGGVVAAGTGAIFGVKAQGERGRITGATSTDGVVTGMTRTQAIQLDAQARTDSIIANSLIGVGVGLAVTGGVLWFLGRGEAQ